MTTSRKTGLYLGTHLSSSKGFLRMGKDALSMGADTFQYFPRNPRGSRAKAFNPDDAAALAAFLGDNRFGPMIAHAPYTMNPCSADPHLRELAAEMMAEDLERMNALPGNLYNIHPGSHVGQGMEEGIKQIAETINRVLGGMKELDCSLLLETMSGKGSEVGGRFEELKEILDRVERRDKTGVCFDTCHLFAAGYDIVNELDTVLAEFDRIIGLERVRAVHVNDSIHPLGSHKDRHALIGEGEIGREAIIRFMTHPALSGLSFVTETPLEFEERAEENALLRTLIQGD